jgi:ribosome biogenesis protein UTP30
MLSKAIGTKFFTKKKQPIPIKLGRTEALPFVIQKCLKSTYMYLSSGTCITIKVGHTGMSSDKLLDNIIAVCESVPMKVPRKWCNVRSISIKTVDSVALPVYNRTPEELEHIAQLAKVGSSTSSTPSSVSNNDDEETKQMKKKVKSSTMVVDTPLARALKKQKIVNTPNPAPDSNKRKGTMDDDDENDESGIVVAKKTTKSSKKVNTQSELMKEKEDKSVESAITTTSTKLSKKTKSMEDTTTILSSKKVKLNTDESVDTTTIPSSKKIKLNTINDEHVVVKSPKKKKVDTKGDAVKTSNNEDNNIFVSATKFIGSKKGYVFTKGKLGLGYYKDIPPIVDKVWRANLGSSSNRTGGSGGNNNRKSMGGGQKRRKGGNNSRRSY